MSNSTKSGWPNLGRAPVVEGIIDLRVAPHPDITFDVLKAACDDLAADFPARKELQTITGELSFSAAGGPNFSARDPARIGIMMHSIDEKWVIQYRVDGFAVSRLAPYTSWADLVGMAQRYWPQYAAVARPIKIVRVASRFINRIPLIPGESFDRTFATTFSIAAALPQSVSAFLLRVVMPFEKENASAIVTQSLPDNSQECIFDLDVFANADPDGATESETWAKLEELRQVKNRLFFESLTPEALESFR